VLSKSADLQIIASGLPSIAAKTGGYVAAFVAPRYQKKALHFPSFGRIVISQQSI
jgi:hypothetical protein